MTKEQLRKRYDKTQQKIFNFRIFVDAAIKKAEYPSTKWDELVALKDEAGILSIELEEKAREELGIEFLL